MELCTIQIPFNISTIQSGLSVSECITHPRDMCCRQPASLSNSPMHTLCNFVTSGRMARTHVIIQATPIELFIIINMMCFHQTILNDFNVNNTAQVRSHGISLHKWTNILQLIHSLHTLPPPFFLASA